MDTFDRWSHNDNADGPTRAAVSVEPAGVSEPDRLAESRSQGEVYADTRQSCESGWERHRQFDAPRDELAGVQDEKQEAQEAPPVRDVGREQLARGIGRDGWFTDDRHPEAGRGEGVSCRAFVYGHCQPPSSASGRGSRQSWSTARPPHGGGGVP